MTITDIDTYRSGLRLIIRFLGGQENYFLLVTIFFSSPQNIISGVNKIYIDMGNWQKFELYNE